MKFSLSKYGIFGIITLCLFIFAVIEIAEAKKKKHPREEPLKLNVKNIVTTNPTGKILRVWGSLGSDQPYENIWNKEGIRYTAVEIGDIDKDFIPEIVAAAYYVVRERIGKGRWKRYYRIVLDVYKKGESDIQFSWEEVRDSLVVPRDLVIADVASNSGNEIILLTDHNLVVFNLVGGELKILDQMGDFLDKDYRLESVAVGNIYGDSQKEIFITASPAGWDSNKGYLFILKVEDGVLEQIYPLVDPIPFLFRMTPHSLAVGHSDGDGNPDKLCSTAYKAYHEDDGYYFHNYLLIWDFTGTMPYLNPPISISIGGKTKSLVKLDVGDVIDAINGTKYPGDEIALLRRYKQPDQLELGNGKLNS